MAIKVESTSGTVEASPGVYMVMGGDIKPVADKPTNSYDVAGQPFPTLAWRGIETFSMPFPMLPVIEDATSPTVLRNGLGELFLCLFGADDDDQLGATIAYDHEFTWENLIKTFTTWLHYSERDQKIRMCAVDKFELGIKDTGELTLDFDIKGADLCDTTDYSSATQIDLATAKQFIGLQGYLEWGQPQAAARDTWENLTLTLSRNVDYGAPGKAGQHPTGSGSPQIVTSTKSEARLKFTIRDTDGEEYERWRQGGITDPTADYQSDQVTAAKARLSIYGPSIVAGINGFADYCNAGTTTATFAGTYGSGSTVTVWEIKITNGTPDQYQYRYTTGTGWSAWSVAANITAGPDALSDGVTVTFSSTSNASTGDKFYCCSHYRYMMRFTLPQMIIEKVEPNFSGGIRKATIEAFHASSNTADRPILNLYDTKTTAYS